MTTTSAEPVHLREPQLDDAGHVLARAFFDDPMMRYLLPDETRRATAMPWFMRLATRYGLRQGEVFTTPERVEGNAVWLPPGKTTISPLQMAMNGMLLAPFKFGLSPFGRFNGLMNKMEKLHKRDMPGPHWYLMILGVDPPRQGQGIGSALVQPILARADAAKLPCYLETSKERNVPFYQRHGFEVIVDDWIEGDNRFRYWTMRRPPRP